MMSILNGSIESIGMDEADAIFSSPEPMLIEDMPEEYVPRPPSRHRPSSATSLILMKRGITLEPLIINGKDHTHKKSPKTPGILKKSGQNYITSHSQKHYVSFNSTSKFKGSTETVDSMPFYRKSSLSQALRSPMVYFHSSFSRFNRPSEGSWRTRDSNTQMVDSSNFISFHNITYTIPSQSVFHKLPPKLILENVRSAVYLWYWKHDIKYIVQLLFDNIPIIFIRDPAIWHSLLWWSYASHSTTQRDTQMHLIIKCNLYFSGVMRAGLNAIMGPSGSGKTR